MNELLRFFSVVFVVSACLGFSDKIQAQSTYPFSEQPYISYKQDTIAFTHCYLADVIHKTILSDETVIIAHGLIFKIGKTEAITIPHGATVIDCTGKTILPGLILLHEHMFYPAASVSPYYVHFKQLPVSFPRLYLACGVTTARTAGSVEPYSDLSLKKEIDAKNIIGPTLYVTAPYMEGAGGFAPQMHEITTTDEAKRFVNFWADEGFTSFKAYMNLTRPVLKAAIEAAHARGLKITGHLCAVTYREAADMGIDQLEHGFFAATDFIPGKEEDACVGELNPFKHLNPRGSDAENLINDLVKHKVILTSTLAVFEGMCKTDTIPTQQVLDEMSPDTRDMYLKYYSHEKSTDMDSAMVKEFVLEKEFADAGGLLTAGTDPTGNGDVLAGYGSLRAIELLTKEGFTPIEAIRIATYNGALALQAQAIIGSIEVGKHADLVVVDGKVADNINNIEKTQWVFKDGIGFNSQKILQQLKGQVGKY